jgi:hypothetical protein
MSNENYTFITQITFCCKIKIIAAEGDFMPNEDMHD